MLAAKQPPAASGAALVPAVAIAVHVILLWWGPTSAALVRPWLPWPLEALLVWLPWVSTCLWAATSRAPRAAGAHRRLGDGLIAAAAIACAADYVFRFRLPAGLEGWSAGRHLSELAGQLSTTASGVPWLAFAYVLGWAATAWVLARLLAALAGERGAGPRAERAARGVALSIFLFGSSALLRYATGGPWPLLGSS